MARSRPLRFVLTAALASWCAALLGGCQPPTMSVTEEGPLVVLTAASPGADFLVRICYEGPELDVAEPNFTAVGRVSSPGFATGPEVVLESSGPDIGADGDGFDESTGPVGSTLDVDLGQDNEAFLGTGTRCTEDRMVHLGVVGDFGDGQEIEIEWSVYVLMRYSEAHRINVGERELKVEIEAI